MKSKVLNYNVSFLCVQFPLLLVLPHQHAVLKWYGVNVCVCEPVCACASLRVDGMNLEMCTTLLYP